MSGTPNSPTRPNSSLKLPRGLLSLSGTPLPHGARLPALRGPKNLALPGSAPKARRTFAANVAASRRAPTLKGADRPAKDRDDAVGGPHRQGGSRQPDQGHSSKRPPHRESPRFIQSEGATFAHGVDDRTKTTVGFASWNSGGFKSEHVGKPKLHSPPSTTTSLMSEQKVEDQKKLELLLRSDFIDDGPAEVTQLGPTTLPLPLPAVEQKPIVKLEVPVVKQETMEGLVVAKEMPSAALRRLAPADVFTDPNLPDRGQLLFLQLPDSLPGLNTPYEQPAREGVPQRQDPSLGKTGEEPDTLLGQIKLKHFPEAYVGKLQVLKSGRVRLLLGAVALTVDLGTQTSFRQDLISLRLPEVGATSAYNLGQVKHKLICLPDMEHLLAASSGVPCHELQNS